MTIAQLIGAARAEKCSDIHLCEGSPAIFRRIGQLGIGAPMTEKLTLELIYSMLSSERRESLAGGRDLDFSVEVEGGFRQRVNVYRQRGKLCAAIRLLADRIPTMDELSLPPIMQSFADEKRGLVLVTGPTGSGKSTTLAAMLDHINKTRSAHIITVEDPIEYVYKDEKCIVHQREVGSDVPNFAAALRSAMREDPDIIMVGEMRDFETISAAVTAAETGHLVLSTLHTTGAAQTIDRIIDVFPPHSQQQIRTQLSGVLNGVITQTLVPRADGSGRIAATEVLVGTDAIRNLIRENKCHQFSSSMLSGASVGMHTLARDLATLVRSGTIELSEAMNHVDDKNELRQMLQH